MGTFYTQRGEQKVENGEWKIPSKEENTFEKKASGSSKISGNI
jgi:hypothetical protein